MKIQITKVNSINVAEIISEKIIITETQDALDLMAECQYQGSNTLILHQHQIVTSFFDLKTGLAGEILQKFSTYSFRLAIVGDFSKYTSKSLRDFIFESNKYGRINFVSSIEEAVNRLSR